MLIWALFLISFSATAREGLHYLNYFPLTESFIRAGTELNKIRIEVDDVDAGKFQETDSFANFFVSYGKKIDQNSYASIEFPFIYREENPLRFGTASDDPYISRGIREPKLSYARRLSHQVSDGDYFTDIEAGLIPGIFQKKTGSPNANGASGATILNLQISTGALYDKYEAKVRGEYEYQSWHKFENLDEAEEFKVAPAYRLLTGLDLQYQHSEVWLFSIGSAIAFASDYDVKVQGDAATIQQGTASIGELGLKYLFKDSFIWAKFRYQANDYFTTSKTRGNNRGDYVQEEIHIIWTMDL